MVLAKARAMGDTDLAFKALAEIVPGAMTWLLMGRTLPVRPVMTPVRWTERTGDFVGIVEPRTRRAHVLHAELEIGRAAGVPSRLSLVNRLLARKHKKPVLSAVVRLRGKRSRLRWREETERLPRDSALSGETVAHFRWLELNVGSHDAEDLLASPELGALPFVPFARGGDRPDVLRRVVRRIAREAKPDERGPLITALTVAAGLHKGLRAIITSLVRVNMTERNWVVDMIRAEGAVDTLATLLETRLGPLTKAQRTKLAGLCARPRAVPRLIRAALAAEDRADFFERAKPRVRRG